MSDPTPPDDAKDVIDRADALLQRHRRAAPGGSGAPAPAAESAAGIPTLTDVVVEGEVLPRANPAPQAAPDRRAGGGEVVSRVQAQNIGHSIHLCIKRSLNDQIAKVVEERYLPEIGAALEQALSRVTGELQSGIAEMVRASVAETL
ncbi:MAG: hypothetical protein ACO3F9_05650, partial [Burkholderiales bacterium]